MVWELMVYLCSSKTLFTKTGNDWMWPVSYSFPKCDIGGRQPSTELIFESLSSNPSVPVLPCSFFCIKSGENFLSQEPSTSCFWSQSQCLGGQAVSQPPRCLQRWSLSCNFTYFGFLHSWLGVASSLLLVNFSADPSVNSSRLSLARGGSY